MRLMTLPEKVSAWIGRNPIRVNRAVRNRLGGNGHDQLIARAYLANICGAAETSWDPDPYAMAFNEGARSVYLQIEDLLRISEAEIRSELEIVTNMGDESHE